MPIDNGPNTQLLIVGDSHTRALQAGCDEKGIRNQTLTLSGTAWFEADVQYHDDSGLCSSRRKWVAEAAEKMGARVGHKNPFKAGLPVLISCMNLGRMLAAYRWRGHQYVDDMTDPRTELPLSRGMMAAYVEEQVARPLALIRELKTKGTSLSVVAPPNFTGQKQAIFATNAFARAVRALDVPCFNPWDHLPKGATMLPKEHAHRDGSHGNEVYGRWVIDHLVDSGAVKLRAPA
ncbi:MAG: hypothetical protein CSA70_01480 [Rhodobacterales bacterium]|nr:MAG: hypothetical protein CSA70_01480 [Rhodobacterales bacterium]